MHNTNKICQESTCLRTALYTRMYSCVRWVTLFSSPLEDLVDHDRYYNVPSILLTNVLIKSSSKSPISIYRISVAIADWKCLPQLNNTAHLIVTWNSKMGIIWNWPELLNTTYIQVKKPFWRFVFTCSDYISN